MSMAAAPNSVAVPNILIFAVAVVGTIIIIYKIYTHWKRTNP